MYIHPRESRRINAAVRESRKKDADDADSDEDEEEEKRKEKLAASADCAIKYDMIRWVEGRKKKLHGAESRRKVGGGVERDVLEQEMAAERSLAPGVLRDARPCFLGI